jgi:hypothetical protein
MAGKTAKQGDLPFILEQHPESYTGYPFITLIQYKSQHILSIVDNIFNKSLKVFVIDLCGPSGINEEAIIALASEWYDNSRTRYPISFEFSKRGMTQQTSKIYRTYAIDSIARVIGPIFSFPMDQVFKVKRRKRREIPPVVLRVLQHHQTHPNFNPDDI